MSSANSPVFYDPAGRRWRRVRRTWLALAILVTCLLSIFIASVLVNPVLPSFNLRPVAALPHTADIKPKPPNVPANPIEKKFKRAHAALERALKKEKRVVPARRISETVAATEPQANPNSSPEAVHDIGHERLLHGWRVTYESYSQFATGLTIA